MGITAAVIGFLGTAATVSEARKGRKAAARSQERQLAQARDLQAADQGAAANVDKVKAQRRKRSQSAQGAASTIRTSPLGIPNPAAGAGAKNLLGF